MNWHFFQKKEKEVNIKKFAPLFIGVILLIFISILTDGIFYKRKNFLLQEKEKNNQQITENILLKNDFEIKEHFIQPGEVFSKLNTALGLSSEKLEQILIFSQKVYDLSNIKAGNKISSFFDQKDKKLIKIEYQIDEEKILLVENFENDELKAKIQEIKYEIEPIRVYGKIKETLYQSGKEKGLEDKIIIEMADIFSWDIDFGFDVREGDEFEIIYEKRYLEGQEVKPGKILIARYQNEGKDYWAVYFKDQEQREDYYDLEGNCLRRQFLKSPLNYRYISSGYSLRRLHPLWGIYTTHQAIDYAASCGTPVSASGAGTIIFAGWKNNVYGYSVGIRHNGTYTTEYNHLSSFAKGIKYGAKVNQGQTIGFVGTTGTSSGCHLDYAMKKYNQYVNPLNQNFDRSEPVNNIYISDFNFYKEMFLRMLSH